ncbi:MAG TPA: S41 family peptidase [Bacteroidales bacterium]|mgnify:FL=1|nr:S41 family peptidase [Bacteroidales bacterium]
MNKGFLAILILFVFTSCNESLLNEDVENTPLGNFDALWDAYDKTYGAFEAKNINWDSLKIVYRSKLSQNSTNTELYNVLSGLIQCLNDGHVQLTASGYKRFYSSGAYTIFLDVKYYENGNMISVFYKLDFSKYINTLLADDNFVYGYMMAKIKSKKVGYLLVPTFSYNKYRQDIVDKAFDEFKSNACAIIIDLRFNGGGATETFLKLLNMFADQKRLYLKSKLRNGPKHSDFTQLYDHYLEPKYGTFDPKPVIVLVNRFSASSSEHFMLGMQTLPYVTVVGDTTYGALSTVLENVLPNGWQFRTCPQVLCDTSGNYLRDSKGRYPDGVGLCPDVYQPNYYSDILNGHDYMLERAMQIISEQVK